MAKGKEVGFPMSQSITRFYAQVLKNVLCMGVGDACEHGCG